MIVTTLVNTNDSEKNNMNNSKIFKLGHRMTIDMRHGPCNENID